MTNFKSWSGHGRTTGLVPPGLTDWRSKAYDRKICECQRSKPFEGDLGLCFAETFKKLCCVECHLVHPEQVFMLYQRNFFASLKVGCGNGIG